MANPEMLPVPAFVTYPKRPCFVTIAQHAARWPVITIELTGVSAPSAQIRYDEAPPPAAESDACRCQAARRHRANELEDLTGTDSERGDRVAARIDREQ